MPADPITDKAVTAAARTIFDRMFSDVDWDRVPQSHKKFEGHARAVLEAAVPHLADQPATTDPAAVDALIAEHAAKFQQVYDRQTAGDHTFTGALAIFAYDLAPLLARQSADRDTCTEPLPVDGDPEAMQTCDHPAIRGTDRCPIHDPRHQQYLDGLHAEIRHLKQTAADRDTGYQLVAGSRTWLCDECDSPVAAMTGPPLTNEPCGHTGTHEITAADGDTATAALRDRLDSIRTLVAKYHDRDDVLPADLVDEVYALTDTTRGGE
jgi:hypothetical protein